MKKYVKPAINVFAVESQPILAASLPGGVVFAAGRFIVTRPPAFAGIADIISVFFKNVGICHKLFWPRAEMLNALL